MSKTMTTWRPVAALAAAVLGAGLLAAPAEAKPAETRPGQSRSFDLQAHRGGLGLRSESTLASFGNALQLGVTTLELDIQITKDGYAVVTHDRRINPAKCQDTAPVTPGDPQFPYAQGRYIKDLTLAQVRTLAAAAASWPATPSSRSCPAPACRC
ncbi:Glycerophosphoryl diester phosphodiesterase family protein [Jiangella alkaliphila]|uniref:Glycerophosphoryl diester phosphodiesterase family protein n=1 Tax=Jiangella alkaliphila TaxID=419479 RepID=A0A1H2L9G0_9ACTN|nr:glycerophosphodiester phosphodiesterase family protein [Jiangella alkaliphila]SDU77355.1 Glycerophosphoryl diester phosphodiesterase family protein [Jiangella alkaliphila]